MAATDRVCSEVLVRVAYGQGKSITTIESAARPSAQQPLTRRQPHNRQEMDPTSHLGHQPAIRLGWRRRNEGEF
jgi:hypothetical protein